MRTLTCLLLSCTLSACSPPADTYHPSANIEVLEDGLGIPHIYAATDEDALYGSGVAMARMRLFQLDMVRRQVRGRLAEVVGSSALSGDLASRAFNFLRLGQADLARVQSEHPVDAALAHAFVSGVNYQIRLVRSGAAPTPQQFLDQGFLPELWTDDDPYALGKMLSFGLSNSLESELLASLLTRTSPALVQDIPLGMPVRAAFTVPGGPTDIGETGTGVTPAPAAAPDLAALQALRPYQAIAPKLGSNNWAVSGRFTDSGRPLLAGDPHQPLGNPLRFFAQHLNSAAAGGTLDVIGFSFAGTPGVQLGHNQHLGWTGTTNFADVMDLWDVQRVADAGGDAILLGGVRWPIASRPEQILVRAPGGPVGQGDPQMYTFTDVPGLGVLLPDGLLPVPRALLAKGQILFRWTGFQPTPEMATYLGMDRARSLDEWEGAIRVLEVGAENFVGAESGSIRYRVHALVPDRGPPAGRPLPWRMMDGADKSTLWTGAWLAEDKLPAAADPARGYLVTANNEPFGFTAHGTPEQAPYYYGYFYDPGDRAARIESELQRLIARAGGAPGQAQGQKISVNDFLALQGDVYSQMADDLLGPLGVAALSLGSDPALEQYRGRADLQALLGQLAAWDRRMTRDSSQAVVFFGLAHFAARRALQGGLGAAFYAVLQAEPAYIFKMLRQALARQFPAADRYFPQGRGALMMGALADTADWLTGRFGGIDQGRYAWKDVHGALFANVLGGAHNFGTVPVDGSIGTVNVSDATMFDGKGAVLPKWTSGDGPIYRMVIGFDADGTPRAVVNFPLGNDEDPHSAHYDDQMAGWQAARSQALPFRQADVAQATTARWTISTGD